MSNEQAQAEAELEDLRHRAYHAERMKEERAISDAKYADKIVQTIVFGMVALILVGAVTAFVNLVMK